MPDSINKQAQIYFFKRERFVRAFAFDSQPHSGSVRSVLVCVCVFQINTNHTEYSLHQSRTFSKIFYFSHYPNIPWFCKIPGWQGILNSRKKLAYTNTHGDTAHTTSHTSQTWACYMTMGCYSMSWYMVFHYLHKNLVGALPWLLRAF